MSVRAPGFEETQRRKVQFERDRVVEWKLQAIKPITGVLLRYTGETGANAKLTLFAGMAEDEQISMPGWSGRDLGKTDEAGRFTLDSLRGSSRYVILAEVPGDGQHLLQ